MRVTNGEYINLFAAFDIYFMGGRDVRQNAFINISVEEQNVMRAGESLMRDPKMSMLKKNLDDNKPDLAILEERRPSLNPRLHRAKVAQAKDKKGKRQRQRQQQQHRQQQQQQQQQQETQVLLVLNY